MDGGQSVGVTVFRRNVPVGRGDARHMGAVLSPGRRGRGDVQIMIHVVVAKGELRSRTASLSRGRRSAVMFSWASFPRISASSSRS